MNIGIKLFMAYKFKGMIGYEISLYTSGPNKSAYAFYSIPPILPLLLSETEDSHQPTSALDLIR